jgi:nucleotidyltransferase/DNA polymerase involved in DNA repair
VVIGGLPHERATVFDLSVEAQRAGVRCGMTLRQAQQMCPAAVFLPLDRDALGREHERALEVLERFSPAVEPRGLEGAYLDLGGLTLLFGEPPVLAGKIARALADELGLTARIGIGPGRFVAWLAAREGTAAPRIIEPDQARAWVARQSAAWLPLTGEGREHLRRLGVRTIGHFARLPAPDIALHFGPEGRTAHRLARGQDPATVTGRTRPETLEAAMQLDSVSLDSRQVVDAARWLAARVAEQLRAGHRSARALTVALGLDSGESLRRDRQLPRPCETAAEAARFVEAMVQDLSLASPSLSLQERDLYARSCVFVPPSLQGKGDRGLGREPESEAAPRVVLLTVTARELGPECMRQLEMFAGSRQRGPALERAIEQIGKRYGGHVKRIVLADEHAVLPGNQFRLEDYV